jgi:hypothetical protein
MIPAKYRHKCVFWEGKLGKCVKKVSAVPTGYETGASEPLWMLWKREKTLLLAEN